MPAKLGEQTPSWNVCGCLGEIYLCIFWQKLFSRSVQSQISDCLHSLLVLFCIFLPFSIRVHYLPFILFFHSVTASGSLFSAYNVFISYVYYHTSSLASHFCDYIDTYSLWLDLARLIFEYFQHILKIFFFFFLFFLIFYFSWYVQMDFKSHSHGVFYICCSKIGCHTLLSFKERTEWNNKVGWVKFWCIWRDLYCLCVCVYIYIYFFPICIIWKFLFFSQNLSIIPLDLRWGRRVHL